MLVKVKVAWADDREIDSVPLPQRREPEEGNDGRRQGKDQYPPPRPSTGNAQISIICLRLYHVTNDLNYLNGALALNRYLRSTQSLTINNQNICGAIAGSYPIWGEYERFAYPNWATKFYVDALMLEKKEMETFLQRT